MLYSKIIRATLQNQFIQVDEQQYRETLNQKGLRASAHVISFGSVTLMTDASFKLTAAVVRPKAIAESLSPQHVQYLLPCREQLYLPASIQLLHRCSSATPRLLHAAKPLAAILKLANKILRPFSYPASKPAKKPACKPQWHTLRLTASDLSTHI